MLDLSRLSPQQVQAVLASDGPLLIVAGPGSGKTTVLAARIAYLVTVRRVPPTSILAITFASRATRELRARLDGLLGSVASAVDVMTFHAFGFRIVRSWGEAVGWRSDPLIVYGQDEARDLLREIAVQAGINLGRFPLSKLAEQLERQRLYGNIDAGAQNEPLAMLAERYEAALRRRGVIDFPAMLALPLRLFASQPKVLRLIQDSYRHVLCDEFQDVCDPQYHLLRLLAARHRNLLVVGDPLQTLYGWRGADPGFLLEFERDFPEARILNLDQNFRATRRLVGIANALGAPLPDSRPLWTSNPPGQPARLYVASDEEAEATFVAAEIARLCAEGQVEHVGEVAVLYRTNQQVGHLVLALRQRGLPYRVRGQGDLFSRREVKDAVAYLRLALNPADAAALARVANVPPRRLAGVAQALRANPLPTHDLPKVAHRFGPTVVAAAESLARLVTELNVRSAELTPARLLDIALERSGYRAWLADQRDGSERLAHLAALRTLVAADRGLGGWLMELRLDGDRPTADDEERVLLTTIHGAKGGEWRWVFVLGVEEGLLPHARALASDSGERDGVEAERRVAYVAVTRPREGLCLVYCRTRRRGDRLEPRRPSRFLQGLPLELVV